MEIVIFLVEGLTFFHGQTFSEYLVRLTLPVRSDSGDWDLLDVPVALGEIPVSPDGLQVENGRVVFLEQPGTEIHPGFVPTAPATSDTHLGVIGQRVQ
jgi:hypothetical protein